MPVVHGAPVAAPVGSAVPAAAALEPAGRQARSQRIFTLEKRSRRDAHTGIAAQSGGLETEVAAAVWAAAIGAVIIVTFVLLSFLNNGPHKISQVTVTNNTPYDLQIDLSGQAKGSTTPLGIVAAMQTTEFPDVIDVGSTWHIAVTSQGHDADDLVIPRSQLKSQGWKLVFGADVTARLRQAGLQPSPTSG